MRFKIRGILTLSRRILLAAGLLALLSFCKHPLGVEGPAVNLILAQAACDVSVRIMPLGDSITRGSSSGVSDPTRMISYRKTLWDSLVAAGYQAEFVGSTQDGEYYQIEGFDPDHEGHGSYRDDQVAKYIYNNDPLVNWLPDNPADIILLHIGTNSLGPSAADVEDILDEIDEYEADTGLTITVILARIINRVPTTNVTTTFNNNVQTMAQARIANGDDIILVNMETGAGIIYSFWDDEANPGDMWNTGTNGLHPYYTGYDKMAAVWRRGIDTLFQHCNQWPDISTDPGTPTHSEGDVISIDFSATDPEGQEEGSGLSYTATNLPPGLTIGSSDGVISGTVDFEAYIGDPYEVTVAVTDSGIPKMSDSVTFTWTINNTNRPPVLTNPNSQTDDENTPVNLHLQADDPDGDSLVFGAQGLPPGLDINGATGLISGTTTCTAVGDYNVTATVYDDGLNSPLSDAERFSWEITETNCTPTLTKPADQNDNEGSPASLQLQADDPDGDSLVFGAQGLPPGLEIDEATGVISGTIGCTAADNSPYNVTVTATDGGSPKLVDSQSFTWAVAAANCAPVVTNPGNKTNKEGDPISLQVAAGDPDGSENLIFTVDSLSPGLSMSEAGLITGTLDYTAADGSPYAVTVTATDPGGLSGMGTFQWIVTNTNRPPAMVDVPDQSHAEGTNVTLQINASDQDNDKIVFSAAGLPPGLDIHPASGLIDGAVACGFAGQYQATVQVMDYGDPVLTDSEDFAWEILPGECVLPEEKVFIPILVRQ